MGKLNVNKTAFWVTMVFITQPGKLSVGLVSG